MQIQKSFSLNNNELGKLYLVGTPIGNLEDMTYRAIRTLGEVELIAAEDTRQTRKLLTHFDIHTPLMSYHEHNKSHATETIIERLKEGKGIALVSDAGMPAISDPGYELVVAAIEQGIPVVPIPGPNAAISALVCSGLPTNRFLFVGFAPRVKKARKEALHELKQIKHTLLFYESPHRLKDFLGDVQDVFGDRKVSIAREITKKFEEWFRGSVREALEWLDNSEARGEFCVVIDGASDEQPGEQQQWWTDLSVEDHVDTLVKQGQTQKEAIKQVAKDRHLPKRDVYAAIHIND